MPPVVQVRSELRRAACLLSTPLLHPAAPCRQGAAVMLSVLLPPERRCALLAGSFTRFWRFTIEQPSRLFLSLAGFRACLLAGRR